MKYTTTALALLLLAMLLAFNACNKAKTTGSGPKDVATPEEIRKGIADVDEYPILWADRGYKDIHDSAKQAWWLTETAYYVVGEKFRSSGEMIKSSDPAEKARGTQMREAVGQEIDLSIFGVNEEVESLFLDAIKAEPENALNYATYAFYLKPRRRINEDGSYYNTRDEALQQVDKAIELWPDDAGFYLLKAFIIAGPNVAHEWFRSVSEKPDMTTILDELRGCYTNAEKYYPQNAYINYSRAIDVFRYTPADQLDSVKEEILREIKEGNAKERNIFYHAPPVQPFDIAGGDRELQPAETEAIYVDQWHVFGNYDQTAVDRMIDWIGHDLEWPRDKETLGDLMFFLYRLGHTQPYDRSYFSLQAKLLMPMATRLDDAAAELDQAEREKTQPERTRLQMVLNRLNQEYSSAAKELHHRGFIRDMTRLDARGINDVEIGPSGMYNVKTQIQPRQAQWLIYVEEQLGYDFPLPADRLMW